MHNLQIKSCILHIKDNSEISLTELIAYAYMYEFPFETQHL